MCYAAFLLGKICVPGTCMFKLQQYLHKRQRLTSASPPEEQASSVSKPMAMDEDEELESAMMSIKTFQTTRADLPTELLDRVERVLSYFHLAMDPSSIPLFKPSMLKTWWIQRVHILCGCLSDPELSEGIMYRYGGTLQLNHIPGEGAKVPIWIPAQGMTGVARWNDQRLVDLKQPGVILPAVFDPALMYELNTASMRVAGQESARTGPIKTGGRVFVLDHTRWTAPMKVAIDKLLQKHNGQKDSLKLVDQDYADIVHQSATDPNSLLHLTTKLHISRDVEHLGKLLNTSSSLDTSQEKRLDTQQLWHSLTEGSVTSSVPVVTMEAAVVKPPTPALPTPLTQDSLEKIVEGILEKQQQQQQQPQPEQRRRQTKTCLACGQPKSRYETDGSSVHFFFLPVGACPLLLLHRESASNLCG
ncbi:uncharacterized protein LOC110004991 [Xyrichtys novacula]|uniref:Uncharacterized protein LOC110004991 n=1 Tax=Xyrichtys novacula TaxID=13765 RepID=A0AAV1ENZ8_XYRNO|nr:uncharacterized protein LOC110004991 [Xyrichtys novacula]